jgi:hypothetical protein
VPIQLLQPRCNDIEEGLGQVSVSFGGFGGLDTTNHEPGFLTTAMTVEDPVQHRRMMGVARINLAKKDLEFYTIGPAGGVTFVLAPDRKHGYGLESAIDGISFGRSTWIRSASRRVRSSRAGRACRSRRAQTTGCCTSTTPAARSTCTTRARISIFAR